MEYVYGVDGGGTMLRIGAVDPGTGKIIKEAFPETLDGIVRREIKSFKSNKEIADFLASHIPHDSNVGICLAGDVDEEELVSRKSPNFHLEGEVVYPKLLKEMGYDVVATNDLRAAGQAAAAYGEGQNHTNVCTVTYSSGHNCAVTRDKKLVTIAEMGHIIYDRSSPLFCGDGGRGHLEPYVSGNGAASMAIQYLLIRHLIEHPILDLALQSYNEKAAEDGRATIDKKDFENDKDALGRVVLSVTAKEVYDAYKLYPDMEPQKSIQQLQTEAIAHSFGLMVGTYNPLDIIVCMGSLVANNPDHVFERAKRIYMDECQNGTGRFQLSTLHVPEIVLTQLPEIGVQGAAAYFIAKKQSK